MPSGSSLIKLEVLMPLGDFCVHTDRAVHVCEAVGKKGFSDTWRKCFPSPHCPFRGPENTNTPVAAFHHPLRGFSAPGLPHTQLGQFNPSGLPSQGSYHSGYNCLCHSFALSIRLYSCWREGPSFPCTLWFLAQW